MLPLQRYAIGRGSNQRHHRHAAPARVIAAALAAIAARDIVVVAASPTVTTWPIGPSKRRFANAAAIITTPLAPPALLSALKHIEREFGRRAGQRWGPRVLDLDILLWSGGRWSARSLTIPHAHLTWRGFVLAPLCAIAPDWALPRKGIAVRHAHHRLNRRRAIAAHKD